MKKIIGIFLMIVMVMNIIPKLSLAADTASDVKVDYSGLVKCDGVIDPSEKDRKNVCDFVALINTAKSLINWAFMISVPIIIGLIAYAGFLYMTGKEGNIDKAKKMLWNAVKGFVIMLTAWVIVTTALKWLVADEFKNVTQSLIDVQK